MYAPRPPFVPPTYPPPHHPAAPYAPPGYPPPFAYRPSPDATFASAPVGSGLRSAYFALALGALGSGTASVALVIAAIITEPYAKDPPAAAIVGLALFGLWAILYLVMKIIGLVWLHARWSWLPFEERYAKGWGSWIGPGMAAGMMVLPYFNYFWMFVINLGLCDALDRVHVRTGLRAAPQKTMAIAACVCEIVPGANVLVAPFLWYAHMRAVDTAMLAVQARVPMNMAR